MELWGLKSLFGFNVYREIQQIPNELRCEDEDDWYRSNLSKSFLGGFHSGDGEAKMKGKT
jgi:hypothetical protein